MISIMIGFQITIYYYSKTSELKFVPLLNDIKNGKMKICTLLKIYVLH